MLKELVDNTYLINLDRREDMYLSALKECNKIGLPFERISAVNGLNLEQPKNYNPNDRLESQYWNRGALALLKTTITIIEDAKIKGYKNILILEDDIEFDEHINDFIDSHWNKVPLDVQMFNFGVQHVREPMKLNDKVNLVTFGFCCHCYMINETVYDAYLSCLYGEHKQIDLITCEDIQKMHTTYCFNRNFAFQKTKFSDINEMYVSRDFLKN